MSRVLVTICLTICLPAALVNATRVLAADWPEFRGPTKEGVSTSESLPVIWSQDKHICWRTELPGEGWSSPIVVGDLLFLTAAVPLGPAESKTGYDLRLFILNADTGSMQDSVSLFTEPPDAPSIHRKNSHASPTPVFDGRHVLVHFGHQGTACLTLEGEVVWKNDSLTYAPVHGNGGSPAVNDKLLFFSRDGARISEVTALDNSTGEIAWRTARRVNAGKKFSFCTPRVIEVGGQPQLILPGSNVVQSLDPRSGEEIWRVTYEGYSVIPRPLYYEGLVFVCTGYDRPQLLAIDPKGRGDITDSHVDWISRDNVPHTPSLVAYRGTIVSVSDKGIATGYAAKTGRRLWQIRIGGNFSASPLLAGDQLYLLSEAGICTVLDLSTAKPEIVAENEIGERCLASLAVVGDDLLLRSDQALYRISNKQ